MQRLNRKTIAILAIIVIVVLALVLLAFSSNKNDSPDLDAGKYYDPNSGETVSNPPGKTPDTFGTNANGPIYLGLKGLTEAGLSEEQVGRLKYAFELYSSQNKKNIKEVSINASSITSGPHARNSNDPFSLLFDVIFDRKDSFKARIEYQRTDDLRLYLYDSRTNALAYDSGPVSGE